jgi:hypothetical protein
MSVEDVKKIRNAYEQMLKDGTAFKEVDMSMMVEPDVSMAQGSLGDKIETPSKPKEEPVNERNDDYTEHDNYMQQRINSLRAKMKGGGRVNESGNSNMAKEVMALKKRVQKLEEALMLVMETHEKILG